MSARKLLLVATGAFALGAVAATVWLFKDDDKPAPRIEAPPAPPPAPLVSSAITLDAKQIASGRLPMERLPVEVGEALEKQSGEIVKNAEAIESRQARITGTCAPGSAIRVIAEDGTVSCQRLPKGIASVAALAGVPLSSATATAAGSVPGGVGRYQTAGEDDMLAVPIVLPDGAVVTSFSFVFYDASEAYDAAAYLYRSDSQTLAEVKSSGAEDRVRTATTDHVDLKRIDAGHYAYLVLFRTSARAGSALLPVSASVSYRLP